MADANGAGFARIGRELSQIQTGLREAGLDGWLLYDLHARNSVASRLLGLGDLSRRYFVFLPASGTPEAVIHGIEEGPWEDWPWARHSYVGWRELEDTLRTVVGGRGRIAMEFSDGDAVPAVDLVPAGVIELVRATGVAVVSSGDLITRFHSRWSDADLASHRRASVAVADAARQAFGWLASAIGSGEAVTEAQGREWVVAFLHEHGIPEGADCILATGLSAANPHYEPRGAGATFAPGDVVLLDLWGKETVDSVYADQTWMGYLGAAVPERTARLFSIIRDARDAAVSFLLEAAEAGRVVAGSEVDDVARTVITDHGYGAFFIHRTGHSIDQAIHGMGPNIDNLETRETRRLVPGVAFSIEPGIYIPGEIGLRTEINVYIGEAGRPEVTTPDAQTEVSTLFRR